ncbi:hypothetical protein AB1K84_00025 [Mesobacillus foraminis]|uniref:hypothetical protein n=1 Tax=Mesobacillus foraminis TaxID=279826 RepID=UPI0039A23997
MLADPTDIADAAFRAGYESQSEFSREYSPMFGCPSRVDLNQMREKYAPGTDAIWLSKNCDCINIERSALAK